MGEGQFVASFRGFSGTHPVEMCSFAAIHASLIINARQRCHPTDTSGPCRAGMTPVDRNSSAEDGGPNGTAPDPLIPAKAGTQAASAGSVRRNLQARLGSRLSPG